MLMYINMKDSKLFLVKTGKPQVSGWNPMAEETFVIAKDHGEAVSKALKWFRMRDEATSIPIFGEDQSLSDEIVDPQKKEEIYIKSVEMVTDNLIW